MVSAQLRTRTRPILLLRSCRQRAALLGLPATARRSWCLTIARPGRLARRDNWRQGQQHACASQGPRGGVRRMGPTGQGICMRPALGTACACCLWPNTSGAARAARRGCGAGCTPGAPKRALATGLEMDSAQWPAWLQAVALLLASPRRCFMWARLPAAALSGEPPRAVPGK